MELYDKLIKVYSTDNFSVSHIRTVIEEDAKDAVTREFTIAHIGIEILKISKNLLVLERDSIADNPHKLVCDGVIAIDKKNKFIGYFELKSACSINNVLYATSQISDSQHHLWSIATKSNIDMLSYTEKGFIITQPISDETYRKARLRRQKFIDYGFTVSRYHFFLNLLKGKAILDTTGMPLLHFNADDVTPITKML